MIDSVHNIRRFLSWTGVVTLLGLFLLAIPHGDATAADARRNAHFDHIKTGFPRSHQNRLPADWGTRDTSLRNLSRSGHFQGHAQKMRNLPCAGQPYSDCHGQTPESHPDSAAVQSVSFLDRHMEGGAVYSRWRNTPPVHPMPQQQHRPGQAGQPSAYQPALRHLPSHHHMDEHELHSHGCEAGNLRHLPQRFTGVRQTG